MAEAKISASRAAQFAPFAALSGYEALIRKREHMPEPRHEPTEEEARALSNAVMQIKRGDLIRVTCYEHGRYRTRAGKVSEIIPTLKRLVLDGHPVFFDDIRSIER
nr:hypothetical protein [Collinsella urealyticum]